VRPGEIREREISVSSRNAVKIVLTLISSVNFITTMGVVLMLTPLLVITVAKMLQALEILEKSIGEVELGLG
jgi:hypothetical protein